MKTRKSAEKYFAAKQKEVQKYVADFQHNFLLQDTDRELQRHVNAGHLHDLKRRIGLEGNLKTQSEFFESVFINPTVKGHPNEEGLPIHEYLSKAAHDVLYADGVPVRKTYDALKLPTNFGTTLKRQGGTFKNVMILTFALGAEISFKYIPPKYTYKTIAPLVEEFARGNIESLHMHPSLHVVPNMPAAVFAERLEELGLKAKYKNKAFWIAPK